MKKRENCRKKNEEEKTMARGNLKRYENMGRVRNMNII